MKVYLDTTGQAQVPRGLRCTICGWAPPPGWARSKKYLYGDVTALSYWRTRYQEHVEIIHGPHTPDCGCIICTGRFQYCHQSATLPT